MDPASLLVSAVLAAAALWSLWMILRRKRTAANRCRIAKLLQMQENGEQE